MLQDLVVRAQAGDLDAFSELTSTYTDRLYAAARLILRDGEQAADAVQDARPAPGVARPCAACATRSGSKPGCSTTSSERATARPGGAGRARSTRSRPAHRSIGRHLTISEPWRSATSSTGGFDACRRSSVPSSSSTTTSDCRSRKSAETLGIPLGTMQSRLSRATQAMRAVLEADDRPAGLAGEVVR